MQVGLQESTGFLCSTPRCVGRQEESVLDLAEDPMESRTNRPASDLCKLYDSQRVLVAVRKISQHELCAHLQIMSLAFVVSTRNTICNMAESPMTPLSPSPSLVSLHDSAPDEEISEGLTTIPNLYRQKIPPNGISISALVEHYDLRVQIITPTLRNNPLSAFSRQPPILGPFSLLDLAIPYSDTHCNFIPTLTANLHDQIGNGNLSVRIKKFCLPLWVVKFWEAVVSATKAQLEWTGAKRWFEERILSSQSVLQESFHHIPNYVPEMWLKLPWDGKLLIGTYPPLNILEVAQLFASESISDTLVDAVMHVIQIRVLKSGGDIRRTLVCDLTIQWALHRGKKGWSKNKYTSAKDFKAIRTIADRIKEERIQILFFPLFVRNNHWVVFEVDFDQKCISYGDSCDIPVVDDDLVALHTWLKHMGHTKKFVLRTLPIALQDDTHSCGVIVWNSIEARIFSDAMWTPDSKHAHRVSYAIKLIEAADQSSFIPVQVSHLFNSHSMYVEHLVCFSIP